MKFGVILVLYLDYFKGGGFHIPPEERDPGEGDDKEYEIRK